MTYTKEQLIEEAKQAVEGCRRLLRVSPGVEAHKISLRLAEITLAALTAEPVGYFGRFDADDEDLIDQCSPNISGAFPLYATPPAPVLPKELFSATEEVLRISDRDHDAWHKAKAGIVSCRAAMLQGAEPVQEWIPCSERMPETDGNYWGWWGESKRQGPVWFIKSDLQAQFQSSEITHWMSLPAAPQQE